MSQGVTVGLLVLLATGLQGGKDLMIAYAYGTTAAADAYQFAYTFVFNIYNVFASAVTTTLIPVYISVKQRSGSESAWAMTLMVAQRSTILLCIIAAVMWLSFPVIVGTVEGFSTETRSQSVICLNFMLVALVVGGMAAVFLAAVNAQGHTAFVSAYPSLGALPILTTAAAFYIHGTIPKAPPLAGATLGGVILQSIAMYVFVRSRGSGRKLRRSLVDADALRRVRKLFLTAIVSSLLVTLVLQVNFYVAADLRPGALATLINGQKLVAIVSAVASGFLSIILLPRFSYLAATGEKAEIARQLRRIIGWSAGIGIPCVILVWLASRTIVEVVFQRGQFDANDTTNVAEVLKFAVLALPFFVTGQVFNQYLLAHQQHRMLALATLLMAIVCIPLAFVLASSLDLVGVAINGALLYFMTCAFLAIFTFRQLRA